MTPSENELERLLRLAAEEPAQRPEFYRALLDSTIYVIGQTGAGKAGPVHLPLGAKVALQQWQGPDGTPVLPFFSSLEALERALDSEASYVALPARTFFEMTCGTVLALNPRSPYGRTFLPHEIQSLLATGSVKESEQHTVKSPRQVLLGQPREVSSAMLASLAKLLEKHANVKAGYLALMHDPSEDEKPHIIIGIEAAGDAKAVIREAGTVAAEFGGGPVDFVEVVRGEPGLSEYFISETTPFFFRS